MTLNETVAAQVAEAAAKEAVAFFSISPEWEIDIKSEKLAEEGMDFVSAGGNHINLEYHQSLIKYDFGAVDSYENLWRVIGHEVAHLVLAEFDLLYAQFASTPRLTPLSVGLTHCIERAVTRLERLFIRQHPYPGDQTFLEAR